MPRIFDNIDLKLLPDLQQAMRDAYCADFCVGYFNLRGWKQLDQYVERWQGNEGNCVRLVVEMQKLPQDKIGNFYSVAKNESELDNQTAVRLKRKLAEEFKTQLTIGAPTIDHALARHYEIIAEELDFIINYDVKYRMGAELEEEE